MIYDYIFCPLCGGTKWLTEKSRSYQTGRLESHKCGACKKFTYTNLIKPAKSPLGLDFFEKARHSLEAEIYPYFISIFYEKNGVTDIRDADSLRVLLTLNSAVTFNWYKNEELISKIKKYLVFS